MDKTKITRKENPVIVFDDDTDNDIFPIEIGYRQPSFVRLQGDPIPKGFDSLDEFIHEKEPVRADPIKCDDMSVQDILAKRNHDKWENLGYDPSIIENQLNRQNSVGLIHCDQTINISENKFSSSFSQLDSLAINKAPLPMIMPIYEDESENNIPVQKSNSLSRSLSSGLTLPNLEYPNTLPDVTEEDSESDSSSYSDEYTLTILENGMSKHVYEILKHEPTTLVYKALCGEQFPNLPYDIVAILTQEMSPYMDECMDNGYEADAFHVQELIDNLRKSADRSQGPLNTKVLSFNVYQKKLLDAYHEFEKKIEYLDTQSFLNDDNKTRSIKKLNTMKLSPQEKEDQIKAIRFTYDKTQFNIKKNRQQEFTDLKSCIDRLRQGITSNPKSPPLPYLTTRKYQKPKNSLSKAGCLLSSTNSSSNRSIIRPRTQSSKKLIRANS